MLKPDPFLLALIATVLLASFVPAHGEAVPLFHGLTIAVIAVMFFMQGARLSRAAVVAGLSHWRLHLAILGCTFVLFPLLGLGLHAMLPQLLTPTLWLGVLFVCVLPSTVQSSIAFTSIARGNIPAAVCSATASNLLGILIAPVLTGLVLSGAVQGHAAGHPGGSVGAVLDVALQLLLPFAAGQLLQPWIGGWALRNHRLLSFTDRGSVLVVVYVAFSEAVVQGLWHEVPVSQLGLVLLVDAALLAALLLATRFGARASGFAREDEIAIVFCGSKKSLATGVPMANVLFSSALVGQIVLPLMIFHQLQLFVCAVLARRYARQAETRDGPDATTGPATIRT